MSDSRRPVWPIVLICLLAVGLRVIAALAHPVTDRTLFPDAGDYHDLGKAIATGGDYRVPGGIAARMPGYPVLISGAYYIVGAHPIAVLCIQAVLGGAACYTLYALFAARLPKVGLLAAGLLAVDPLSIVMSASLLSEASFSLALLALVGVGIKLWTQPASIRLWILFGIVAAVAIYLRVAALYLPALLAAGIAARHFSWRACGGVAAALVIILGALLPWKIFLSRHEETATLSGLTSLEGISLYEAVYPAATGGPMQGEILRAEGPAMKFMREGDRNNYYAEMAEREIKENPGRMLRLAPVKFSRTWSLGLNAEPVWPGLNVVLWVWHLGLFGLVAVGLLSPWTGGAVRVVTGLTLAYFTLLHMVFIGSVRYRVPLHPLLCMLAAMGVWTLVQKRQRSPGKVV